MKCGFDDSWGQVIKVERPGREQLAARAHCPQCELCGLPALDSNPRKGYDCTIFSRATRLRITRVAPRNCINCFFLNSENKRLTVSRVVPMISAISSWVSVSFTWDEPSSCVDLVDHESSSLANFSEGEAAK